MALNLLQALDFAIGVDNTSVNLVYLREVLVTVLKTLDIEDVVVGKWDSNDDEFVSGEEEHVELDVVAEITRGEGGDEEREFSGCETEDITEGRDDDDSSIPGEKINEKGHEGDTVDTTVKRSTRGDHTRCHSDMDIFQVSSNLTRSESDFSKLHKFARRGYHSSLSSKVFVLEANVERLQDIVSNIIAQVNDKNNARNLNSGPPTQVCEGTGTADPGTLEDRVESIHQLEGCVGSRSLSPLEIGDENYGDSRPERETGRQTREELRKDSKGRPVTQPVFSSTTRLPVASRSKTANVLSSRKQFARENSLLKQWKHRQTVSTIEEEVVEGELRTDGIISEGHCPEDVKQEYEEERNSGGKVDFGSDVGVDGECEWIDRVEEDETETNDDFPLTWSDTESGADTQDNLALDTPVAINDRGDPYPVVKSPHVSLKQMQLWREEFLTIEEKLRAELDAQWNFIRTLGNNVELLRSEDKDKVPEKY